MGESDCCPRWSTFDSLRSFLRWVHGSNRMLAYYQPGGAAASVLEEIQSPHRTPKTHALFFSSGTQCSRHALLEELSPYRFEWPFFGSRDGVSWLFQAVFSPSQQTRQWQYQNLLYWLQRKREGEASGPYTLRGFVPRLHSMPRLQAWLMLCEAEAPAFGTDRGANLLRLRTHCRKATPAVEPLLPEFVTPPSCLV